MQRKRIILLAVLILSGCSVPKKAVLTIPEKVITDNMTLTERLLGSNITAMDFDIIKAEIDIFNNGENRKLLCSIKYRKPGNYLIAVKHRSGMEAARIYITNDTIMVNDRIYKNLYIGSKDYLFKKYGIETRMLPLVFGDYLNSLRDAETIKDCKNGISEIQGYLDGKEIWYFIDCNKGKLKAVKISDRIGTSGININFDEFKKSGNNLFPGRITVEDTKGENKVIISIGEVEYRDSEKIEFIPGRNYKKIILK